VITLACCNIQRLIFVCSVKKLIIVCNEYSRFCFYAVLKPHVKMAAIYILYALKLKLWLIGASQFQSLLDYGVVTVE